METMLNRPSLAQLTPDKIQAMSDEEMLRIIYEFSANICGNSPDPNHDHRRRLSRTQLECLVTLIQKRFQRPSR